MGLNNCLCDCYYYNNLRACAFLVAQACCYGLVYNLINLLKIVCDYFGFKSLE